MKNDKTKKKWITDKKRAEKEKAILVKEWKKGDPDMNKQKKTIKQIIDMLMLRH